MHYLVTIGYETEKLDGNGNPRLQKFKYIVEGDAEPGIDVAMDRVVAVAELAWSDALLEGLGLGRRAVFVGAAYIECLVAAEAAEACEDICGKYLD